MSDENSGARHESILEVTYPRERGAIGIRGTGGPLSWEETTAPSEVDGDRHIFKLQLADNEVVELKLVRNEEDWAAGRNYLMHAGERIELEPYFDRNDPVLVPTESLEVENGRLVFDVLLPPSYEEQASKRYPVLYVLDGQSLWSHSEDPFGVWNLDQTLTGLYDLSAMEEAIVVGIHTADSRLETMTPVPDERLGGGKAQTFLDALLGALRPHINERYRVLDDRDSTAIMGSSMGGLFAFFAAWSRPDVFGKAACLSSSFWWANRWAMRAVMEAGPRDLKPHFYIDSGAAMNPFENDPNVRDGFHHTRSMMRSLIATGYTLGHDLHRLVFAGQAHNAGSWAARVALPLQMLFPPVVRHVS